MKVEGNDRAFAAWEDLRRRVEALENSIPLNSRVDPPGCPACDGVAGTECRCDSRECCTDGTCESCAPLMAWTDYRKDYQPNDTVTASKAFRAGWEASREYHRDTPDPEPLCAQTDGACHSCGLDKGHEGRHKCYQCPDVGVCGHIWSPVPQCGATFNEHRCTLDKDHEGWHQEWVERLVDTATWPEVPRSALMDEFAAEERSALSYVLDDLADIAADVSGARPYSELARIVAVAEGRVGAGWQADPDRARFKCGIQDLIDALPAWTTLGNRAASWLRDLTDGAE